MVERSQHPRTIPPSDIYARKTFQHLSVHRTPNAKTKYLPTRRILSHPFVRHLPCRSSSVPCPPAPCETACQASLQASLQASRPANRPSLPRSFSLLQNKNKFFLFVFSECVWHLGIHGSSFVLKSVYPTATPKASLSPRCSCCLLLCAAVLLSCCCCHKHSNAATTTNSSHSNAPRAIQDRPHGNL